MRRAWGAMTSLRSKTPASYISSGKTGSTRASGAVFFPNGRRSLSAILLFRVCDFLVQRHRLTLFTGIEHLIEKLDCFFRSQLHRAHSCSYQSLLHDRDALLELGYLLFERFVELLAPPLVLVPGKKRRTTPFRYLYGSGRIGNRNKEILRHDIRRLRETFDEFDIFAYLNAHEIVELSLICCLEGRNVRSYIEHARLDEYLDGKVEGIEEVLELNDERRLLIFRLKREVK